MTLPRFPGFRPDPDDPTSIDDMFIRGSESADVHLERMDNGYYWIGVTIDGVTTHIDITIDKGRRTIRARVRR